MSQFPTGQTPFRVIRKIASGASSTVYEAINETRGERVALKVFLPLYTENPEWFARIEREAETLRGLRHPHIARFFDFWHVDDQAFIEMEYVEGRTLRQWLDQDVLPLVEPRLWALVQIARALGGVHEDAIVHRDLKPDNILVAEDGTIKLADFGLARTEAQQTLTQAGSLVGSLAYMAPEVIRGEKATPRSDLFSFGALAWEMMCRSHPFPQESAQAVLKAILETDREACRARHPELPERVASVIDRCLERDPLKRPENIWVVEAALMSALAESGLASFAKAALRSQGASPAETAQAFQVKHAKLISSLETLARATDPASREALLVRLNEFSALFPDDQRLPEFMALLASRSRKRNRKGTWVLLGILTLVLGFALVLWNAPRARRTIVVPLRPDPAAPPSKVAPEAHSTAPVPAPAEPKTVAKAAAPKAPAKPRPKPAPPATGTVNLSTDEDTQVFIDDRAIQASARARIELAPGAHRIRLVREGFLPIEQTIQVSAGKTTNINARGGRP